MSNEPYEIGDLVKILGSGVKGFISGYSFNIHTGSRYDVEYVDANGNPQERPWHHDQLTLMSNSVNDLRETYNDNVVPFGKEI